LEGNRKFQALLEDPKGIEHHLVATRKLIDRMSAELEKRPFLAGTSYSFADCFATAALARFTIHGFAKQWEGSALDDYYKRMKARPSFAIAQVIETGTERDL